MTGSQKWQVFRRRAVKKSFFLSKSEKNVKKIRGNSKNSFRTVDET